MRSGRDKEGVGLDEETGESEKIRHCTRVFQAPRAVGFDEFAGRHTQSAPSATLKATHDFVSTQLEDTVLFHGELQKVLYHPGRKDSSGWKHVDGHRTYGRPRRA